MSRSQKKNVYRKSRRFDASCRSHGGCPWCLGNHRHAMNRRLLTARESVIDAAVEWGNADRDNAVESLASELWLSKWLIELDRATKGLPPDPVTSAFVRK